MKPFAKRMLSCITAAASLLSLFTVFSCVSAADKKPEDIDRVVVDCRSAEAFAKTSKVYVHTPTENEPDPFTGGKYEFNSDIGAMEVLYNENQKGGNQFRVLTMFNQKGNLTDEYKYFVIVYAAKTAKPYKLTLWNGLRAGPEITIADSGKDTKAKFVVSDAFDISGANANGISTLSRWMGTIHATINFGSGDPDARFFIKEYAFFKSPEDAKAYYAGVDLNEDPKEYGENAVKPSSAAPAPAASAKPVDPNNNVHEVKFNPVAEPAGSSSSAAPEAETVTVKPIIWNFSSKEALNKTAKIRDFSGDPTLTGIGGIQEFVTLPDGTQAMKLLNSPYSGFDHYRVMPHPNYSHSFTKNHKYVCITYMTTDIIPHSITLRNNASSEKIELTADTSVSRGEFVTTSPVDFSNGQLLTRFINGTHNTIQVNSIIDNSEIYIKELAFFGSEKQAYEYYGDKIIETERTLNFIEIPFGDNGIMEAATDDPTWGVFKNNENDLEITYAEKTNFPNVKYMAKIRPTVRGSVGKEYRYMRILYSADNPDDVKQASMFMRCDMHANELIRVDDSIVDTNGKFVLSDIVYIYEHQNERWNNGVFNTLFLNTNSSGGTYRIKSVLLFPDRESAEAYNISSGELKLTVAGNDISKYQIVIGKDTTANVKTAAEEIASIIENNCGAKIPVVTDEAPLSDCEIIIGQSSRTESTERFADIKAKNELGYAIYVKDSKLIITSPLGLTTVEAVNAIKKSLFFDEVVNVPEAFDIPADLNMTGVTSTYVKADFWNEGTPVADPKTVTVTFDTDEGYYNEDDGQTNWKYADGKYVTDAKEYAPSYLHVYEKNVVYKATLSYTAATAGSMGIIARMNSYDAYVKAGYDFAAGEWYIESRDGKDYYLNHTGTAKAELTPGTEYALELTLLGDKATLKVNGTAVITDAAVDHLSPGRLGVYAENAAVSVDNIEITLTSGQGTVWQNVHHTRIPGETYLEGGTVTEMKDGSLIYTHYSGTTYKSFDNGTTWQKTEKWLDTTSGYPNIIRLPNGDLLHTYTVTEGGVQYRASRTSSDEGKTWVKGGIICELYYKGSKAAAGNMNDKLSITASGRIMYGQAYEVGSEHPLVEGRRIFCRYYFSDDNGKTWWKSDTDSWMIPGIEKEQYFGENKLLECADGTIRMYASWHMLGKVAYSESTDGGKTFGPLQYLENMPTPTSSMQFVKDEYADNDYTYYMVWLNAEIETTNTHTPRSRLSLAKTTNGKDWVYLGDVMRWESTYMMGTTIINHVVDPFIKTTEDYIICGTGFAEGTKVKNDGGPAAHQGQRQNIFAIRKDTLPAGIPVEDMLWR